MNHYRKSVPKSLKDKLWDETFGSHAGEGECYVCGVIINSKRFEAGHIISVFNNGGTNLNNLKCICSTCNKSMGTQNLEDFKKRYFPAIKKRIRDESKKCTCNCHINNCNSDIDEDIIDTIKMLDTFKFKNI